MVQPHDLSETATDRPIEADALPIESGTRVCELCEEATLCEERYGMCVCRSCADTYLP